LETTRVKVVVSVICIFVITGLLSPFFIASLKLQSQRNAIESVLRQANFKDRDPISVGLVEKGEVATPLHLFKSSQ
jgi:hypothetical protein